MLKMANHETLAWCPKWATMTGTWHLAHPFVPQLPCVPYLTCVVIRSLAPALGLMAFGRDRPAGAPFMAELVDDAGVLPLPASTKWYRDHGRRTRREKAVKEQHLNPNEEKGLSSYVLRISQNGYPLAVKILRSLTLVIQR
jgi:hypothetical protein